MIIDKILSLKIDFLQTFGYWIVFFATFFESLPMFGLFIPGSLVVFMAGFFSRLDIFDGPFFNIRLVILFAVAGAILGDLSGYLFGKYFGKKFLGRFGKYFLIRKEYMDKTGELVCEHTGKSLVLGRMNPLTRSAAPFIAGAHKVNFGRFMFFNVIGAALWGFLFASLGFIFGRSYYLVEKLEKSLILTTLTVIVLMYIGFYIKQLYDKRTIANNFKCGHIGACVEKWA